MALSLNALSRNIHKDQCKNLNKFYSGKRRDLLLRKGVYSYDYVSSINVLSKTQLPPKICLLSDIGNEDYELAKAVWKKFGFKTFREYHDSYNVSDVLLLADVFENFRNLCRKNYKLNPTWYYTSPGLAFDATLKITSVEL